MRRQPFLNIIWDFIVTAEFWRLHKQAAMNSLAVNSGNALSAGAHAELQTLV
jgi:hypothetical protein